MELSKQFTFEASHILPNHPGKCSNLHGHSWVLTVYVEGPIDPTTGMVMDFYDIKQAVQPIVDDLDHAHLGAWKTGKIDIHPGTNNDYNSNTKNVEWFPYNFNPTSENLLIEIAKQLIKKSFVFSALSLDETCTTRCTLTLEDFNALSSK